MGIAYPHEIETGELERPSFRHAPFDVARHAEALVVPIGGGVAVAGVWLASESPIRETAALRSSIAQHFLDRRPDADRHTWARFEEIVHGLVACAPRLDANVTRAIAAAIDGL
jgi:hypothetical protein